MTLSFLTYFCCVRNAFCSPTLFLSADAALVSFMSSHFILFLFEGRPVSTVVPHPAGSQVCYFSGEFRRKRGRGHKILVLTPLLKPLLTLFVVSAGQYPRNFSL